MLVAALGDDEFGAEARAALAREGVGTDVLVTLEHTATGVALILVDAKAENQIAVAPGANAGLTATHVRQALGRLNPHAGDAVIVTHEIPTDAAREALRIGRAGRGLDDPQPGPGRRARPLGDLAGRRRGARTAASSRAWSPTMPGARAEPDAGAEEPVKAARTLLEATREGPGAGKAILVSLGAAGAVLVRRDGPRRGHQGAQGQGDRRHGCRRRAQRRARRGAGRRAGPRGGGPARGRGGERVRDAGRGPRGLPDARRAGGRPGRDAAVPAARGGRGGRRGRRPRSPERNRSRDADAGPPARRPRAPAPRGPASAQAVLGRPGGPYAGGRRQAEAPLVGDPPRGKVRARGPRRRCRRGPRGTAPCVQTSAQAGSGAATVTAISPVRAGSPVRGSTRWCTARPSGPIQCRTRTDEVATAPDRSVHHDQRRRRCRRRPLRGSSIPMRQPSRAGLRP